ncbi:hypothetical protein [Kitasatospora sp. NPDC085879]|uniref:hypothetical protein n=1 Tax=Kitasatospora sp. NPDC085879 TaxID=3154769 RepID=UPI00342521DD
MRLRTSDPHGPGLRRTRCGGGFRYLSPNGRPVTDRAELDRIRALAVPPAWTDIWICPHPGGHLQALGTDAKDRCQYLHHPEVRARQQEPAKHEHVLKLSARLPEPRAAVDSDLRHRGLPRDRVMACAVRLLNSTCSASGPRRTPVPTAPTA